MLISLSHILVIYILDSFSQFLFDENSKGLSLVLVDENAKGFSLVLVISFSQRERCI